MTQVHKDCRDVLINYVRALHHVKVKLSLCNFLTEYHAMKAYWGSGGIAPLIF
jgi:hypothetical protein